MTGASFRFDKNKPTNRIGNGQLKQLLLEGIVLAELSSFIKETRVQHLRSNHLLSFLIFHDVDRSFREYGGHRLCDLEL